MARYHEVAARTWNSRDFASLSERGKLVWLFFLTGAVRTPLPGIYNIGIGTCIDHLRVSKDEFIKAFEELSDRGMAEADWNMNVVYLPNWWVHNRRPANGNVVKGWLNLMDTVPDCELKEHYISNMIEFLSGLEFAERYVKEFAGDRISTEEQETASPELILDEYIDTSKMYHSKVKEKFPNLSHLRNKRYEKTCIEGAKSIEQLVKNDGYSIDKITKALEWVVDSYDETKEFNWLNNLQSLKSVRRKSVRNGNTKFENILNSMITSPINSKKGSGKILLSDYTFDTAGFFVAFCTQCKDGSSYDKSEIYAQESRCCKAKIAPVRA